MKRAFVFLFLFLSACGSAPIADRPNAPESANGQLFADASNRFAIDLHARLPREGSLVYSPASISMALAMTYAGAEGATETEMRDVMHFGDDADAIHGSAASVLADWNEREGYELAIANRLFAEESFTFEEPFLALTRDRYGAGLDEVSFIEQPEAARVRINTWAAEQTHDRIRDLVPPGALDGSTRLVLTNAIYLNAEWAHPFTREATREEDFFAPSGTVRAAMMHQTTEVRHAELDGAQVLELPYRGGELAMWVALPNERDGIAALESSLDADRFARWESALSPRRVQIALPKARIDPPQPIDLAAVLASMGMDDAFDPDRADFSAMSTADELFISAVFHKAFAAIDEKGTEAAAATAVVMTVRSMPLVQPPDVVFTADHPYLFFIRDVRNGAMLFVGRVMDPS
jgi:serpin B